ncbi:uncharacterized protein LTR77_010521 [Saxophila tyrrhenica]|uniref:Uncharacterized protein n=1 Tax=Saxophila tyrrhenica TaxID=1690608 RepID=A0AAV9NV97_9PEZI|nr:hypothetical protein LTR77_010521 [Saxophila tyrrhenica]
MGFFDVLKIVFLPAVIAASIYGLLVYVILPVYRHQHAQYSQYLPLHQISERTSGFRSRVQHTLTRWILPRHLQWRFDTQTGNYVGYEGRRGSASTEGADEELFEAEEGERMVGFAVNRSGAEARSERELLSGGSPRTEQDSSRGQDSRGRGVSWRDRLVGRGETGGYGELDSERRLSRELESGFRDSSESENTGDDRRQ